MQAHFAAVIVELDVFDAGDRLQRQQIRARIQRFEQDAPRVVLAAQSGDRLIQHLAALVNHHDLLAQLLGMRHDVRREDDGGAALLFLAR